MVDAPTWRHIEQRPNVPKNLFCASLSASLIKSLLIEKVVWNDILSHIFHRKTVLTYYARAGFACPFQSAIFAAALRRARWLCVFTARAVNWIHNISKTTDQPGLISIEQKYHSCCDVIKALKNYNASLLTQTLFFFNRFHILNLSSGYCANAACI